MLGLKALGFQAFVALIESGMTVSCEPWDVKAVVRNPIVLLLYLQTAFRILINNTGRLSNARSKCFVAAMLKSFYDGAHRPG